MRICLCQKLEAVTEEGMRSAVRRPCEMALTIPVNYDTHLLCPFYITQRGGSLVEFDSRVSYSSIQYTVFRHTHTEWRVLKDALGCRELSKGLFPSITLKQSLVQRP